MAEAFGKRMKTSLVLIVIVLLFGCRGVEMGSTCRDTSQGDSPWRFNSIIPKDPDKADVFEILIVSYADAKDPTSKKSRLFIANGLAFRTLADLKKHLLYFPGGSVHFVLRGNDDMPAPDLESDEIDDLVLTCRKANVWITYAPGG